MNTPMFDQTVAWLEAGAQHKLFSMRFGHMPLSSIGRPEKYSDVGRELTLKPDCGSVCCIGGYLAEAAFPDLPVHDMLFDEIQHLALEALGLIRFDDYDILPIFDPHRAPPGATPTQAAVAMRNWQANNFTYDLEFNPWN